MANTFKQDLESRISIIKDLIIKANDVYQQYLQKGDNASISEYEEVQKAISNFYSTQTSTEHHPRHGYIDHSVSMYAALQHHRSLACKLAIRKMDKNLLKENGIVTKDLIEFNDQALNKIIDDLKQFYIDCSKTMNIQNIDFKIMALDIVAEYTSSIKKLPMSELSNLQLPPVEEFAKEVEEKVNLQIRSIVSEYKNHISKYEDAFKKYKAKGEKATYAEFEELQIAIGNEKVDGLNNSIKEIAINELKNEGSIIGENLDKYGWLERTTDSEKIAYHYISNYESDVRKICERIGKDETRTAVLKSLRELIETMKAQPISSFPNKEILEPKVFVSVTLEKLAQEKVANAPEQKNQD